MNSLKRTWIVTLAAVVAVAATSRLGWWQLDRAAQKLALQSQLDARRNLPALKWTELARTAAMAGEQHFRSVVIEGRWLPKYSVFLDNRQMNGRVGFFLVTPLELAPGLAVLVQRGWAPRDIRDRTLVPSVATPTDRVTIVGRIAPPPGRLYALGGPEAGPLRQNLALEEFSREIGTDLLPLSIQQTDDVGSDRPADPSGAPPGSDGLMRMWAHPAVDVQKHYGYAFQWFGLSSLLTGLYVWFQLLQPWLRRRPLQR